MNDAMELETAKLHLHKALVHWNCTTIKSRIPNAFWVEIKSIFVLQYPGEKWMKVISGASMVNGNVIGSWSVLHP